MLARNPRVQRGARNLAREGLRRWEQRNQRDGDGSATSNGRPSAAPSADTSRTSERSTSQGAHFPGDVGPLPDRDPAHPLSLSYSPSPDGEPDPGEVVWAWVPFEEDPSQGKDRPLLVLAVEGSGADAVAIGLMLTSRDRGRGDHTDKYGNRWVDIGTGPWDSQGRLSEVRIDRLIQVRNAEVRREGGNLDRSTYERVAKATRSEHGW